MLLMVIAQKSEGKLMHDSQDCFLHFEDSVQLNLRVCLSF